MDRFLKNRGKIKKRILYICVAVVIVTGMAVSAFAQELPAEAEALPTGDTAAATSAPQETPVPTQETSVPEETTAPGPAVTPESSETMPPDAEQEPSEEPAAGETSAQARDIPAEELAEESQAAENIPVPTEEPKRIYDAPAIFLKDIVAKGDNATLELTEEQLADIEGMFPKTLSAYRREVVMNAYSLVGKVHYFWGGKSTATGWDIRWGNEAIVGSEGSAQTGTSRVYGLDCSGYVLWSFVNAEESLAENGEWAQLEKTDVINRTGYGTAGQWEQSTDVSWDGAQPGDLAFYGPPTETPRNHVGIIVGRNEEGKLLAAHCSSTQNSVVISEAQEEGFRYIRTLKLMQTREEDLAEEEQPRQTTMPNGVPVFLTEAQAYEGAVKNGWSLNE